MSESLRQEFDTVVGVKWFTIVYELEASGRKRLMSIYYDDLPIDVVELKNSDSPGNKELYEQICAAMDNNAESIMEAKKISNGLFETIGNITKDYAKQYGINLK